MDSNVFKKYDNYIAYTVFILYIIIKGFVSGDISNTETFTKVLENHFVEVFFVGFMILIALRHKIKTLLDPTIEENKFFDTLISDLTSDSNPLFIQIRNGKVPVIEDDLSSTISSAIESKEWWDFSYFGNNSSTINEIEAAYMNTENPVETANLTVLNNYPFGEDNYIFIGHISYNEGQKFPSNKILNPSVQSPYTLNLERMYVYKQTKNFLNNEVKTKYRMIEDKYLIYEKYTKIVSKLRKNIDSENILHVSWGDEGEEKFSDNSTKDMQDFIKKLKEQKQES